MLFSEFAIEELTNKLQNELENIYINKKIDEKIKTEAIEEFLNTLFTIAPKKVRAFYFEKAISLGHRGHQHVDIDGICNFFY